MADTIIRVEYNNSTYDLEVLNDLPLRLNVSAVEVGQIGELLGVGSQTFTLPGTKANNKFFKHAEDLGASSVPGFYNSIPGYVIYEGETLLKGQFMLLDVTTDNDGYTIYNCQITDSVVQLKDNLANQFIAQADWSAYDHTISSASIIDSWDGNLLNGAVYYPVAEYGDEDEDVSLNRIGFSNGGSGQWFDSQLTPLLPQQLVPAIRARDCMQTIINQVGFRPTGSFFESTEFEDVYVLPKSQEGVGFVAQAGTTATFFATADITSTNLLSASNGPVVIPFKNELNDPTNAYDPTDSYYTMDTIGNYTFSSIWSGLNPFWLSPNTNVDLTYKLMVGTAPKASNGYIGSGGVIDSDVINLTNLSGFVGFTANLGAVYYNTNPGQEAWIWLTATVNSGSISPTQTTQPIAGNFQCTKAPIDYEGSQVNMALQFPSDLRSIDVVDAIVRQFNLVLTPHKTQENTIEVDTFDNWMLSGSNVDWTDKFNSAERISIGHTVDEVARELIFKQADDVDRFSKTTIENEPGDQYGTLRLLADNNISQGKKTIESKFSPVILAASFLSGSVDEENNPTYNVDLNSRFVVPHLYKFENNRILSYKFKPRIGYKTTNQNPSGSTWYFGAAGQNPQPQTQYTTLSNVDALPVVSNTTKDLHFNNTYGVFSQAGLNLNGGKNAYDNYWKILTDSIYWEDSRKVTMDVKFSPKEYKEISLNDHVFIKDTQFKIDKISGYNLNSSDVITVTLTKLYPAYVTPNIVPDCDFIVSGSRVDSCPTGSGNCTLHAWTTASFASATEVCDWYNAESSSGNPSGDGGVASSDGTFTPSDPYIRVNDRIFDTAASPASCVECTKSEGWYGSFRILSGSGDYEYSAYYITAEDSPGSGCLVTQESLGCGAPVTPAPTPTPTPFPTPSPTPSPVPTPSPSPVPTLSNGWQFTAGLQSNGLIAGYHQGTLFGCPTSLNIGTGYGLTTATVNLPGVDCYSTGLFLTTKGYGLIGYGSLSGFALNSFQYDSSNTTNPFSITLMDRYTLTNPGSGTLSGTINGSDGSSATFSTSYSPSLSVIDNNGNGNTLQPESFGYVTVSGITSLVNGVIYTIEI